MMGFKFEKSYRWLFPIMAGSLVISAIISQIFLGNFFFAAPIVIAQVVLILIAEWKSGIALNAYWVAAYRRETTMFYVVIWCQLLWVVLATIFMVIALSILLQANPKNL